MSNDNRPLIPVNPKGLDAIAKALLEGVEEKREEGLDSVDFLDSEKENYMILEGREHTGTRKYQYGDLFVSLHRLGMNLSIERIKSGLGFAVANTGQEQDGTNYIGNINWAQALKLNLGLGAKTLNPRQGIDFLVDLKDGIEGRKVLHYASGKVIPNQVLQRVFNEIVEVRNPYRAEWFDADFKVVKGVLHINYDHQLGAKGVLTPRFSEPLEAYLDGSGVKVSLSEFNRQGLATKKNDRGEILYWKPLPDNDSVARFSADSYGTVLSCDGDATVVNSRLGVRQVRKKLRSKYE